MGEIVLHEEYNDFYKNNYIIISIIIIFDKCIDVAEYIELYLSESSQWNRKSAVKEKWERYLASPSLSLWSLLPLLPIGERSQEPASKVSWDAEPIHEGLF